jgi:uncharacterized glyoxalase superfamily protein PhnB
MKDMKNVVLELMVDNIQKSVSFYTDILGFEKEFEFPENNPTFVSIAKDEIKISFFKRDEFSKEIPKFKDMRLGGSFALNIEIDDIQKPYDSIKKKATIIKELYKTNYGTLEFTMEDSDGYVLLFKQNI